MEVAEETLTVMQGMGVATRARSRCRLTLAEDFAPIETIKGAVIKEGLTASDVKTFLAFERQDPGAHSLMAFARVLPPLTILKNIHQDLQIPQQPARE